MKKVMIGMSFYNNEDTLEYAIKSIINQTFEDWYLILINDGSTDASVKIAKKYVSDNILLLNDGENKGLISRLNQLIKICNAQYFVRMDSDDIMLPDRLQNQISFLDEHTDIDVVGGKAYIINEFNQIIGEREVSNARTVNDILQKGMFIHPTVAGKAEWFKKHCYDYKFNRAEDLELWCRAFNNSNFANLEEYVLFYRDPEKLNLDKYKSTITTVKKIIDLYADNILIKYKLSMRENIKGIIYTLLTLINKSQWANHKRNPKLNINNEQYAKKLLLKSVN